MLTITSRKCETLYFNVENVRWPKLVLAQIIQEIKQG